MEDGGRCLKGYSEEVELGNERAMVSKGDTLLMTKTMELPCREVKESFTSKYTASKNVGFSSTLHIMGNPLPYNHPIPIPSQRGQTIE
ncbi:hypothetical protein O6P43_033686 [Quillaja saponaria]|uniref:Uncharacterized protein n=1 Tax=Quillaja saponaria TaxID=32244 RepID=A0AAD7KQP6_QUISA|nr:hypothetical protein O6P43_033686 [Quillaja saponaria]